MLECLLIKVSVIDSNNTVKLCEYFQVLKEEFYSFRSNSMKYKYYTLSRRFKKRLSRHTATILLSYTTFLDLDSLNPFIAKNDDEYLNMYFRHSYATIVYKYTI